MGGGGLAREGAGRARGAGRAAAADTVTVGSGVAGVPGVRRSGGLLQGSVGEINQSGAEGTNSRLKEVLRVKRDTARSVKCSVLCSPT